MKTSFSLRHDLPASIVVLFVAVPLCLGIALASGAPLFSGLIAGIIGGMIVGSISGSALGVSGPAAGLAVIVLSAIDDLGFEAFLVTVVIAGGVQILAGVLRAGVLGYFFPSSVIRGMLTGIGVIIFLKQIPHAFGYDRDPEGELQFVQPDGETTFSEISRMIESVDMNAVLVSGVALALMLVWDLVLSKRAAIFRLVQGPLVAVAFGILYQVLTSRFAQGMALSPEHLVSVPVSASLGQFMENFTFPDWSRVAEPAIWVTGVTVAVVGSLETLLCLDATDKLDPEKRITPANRELVAQGVGNMLSGAIGGLPITQVIVRSSANIQSGAKSKLSAILHGVLLLMFVLLLPQVLNLVPLAVLAAILLIVGYKLAKPALFVQMFRAGQAQFIPFIVTVAGIVFTDLLTGIGMGMALAIGIILIRNYSNSHFLHIEESKEGQKKVIHLTLAEEVTFINKAAILRELAEMPDGVEVVIDRSRSHSVDADVLEIIDDFVSSAAHRGIDVQIITKDSTTSGAVPQPA